MKINKSIILGLGLFALPVLLQAQLAVSMEETPMADSIVTLTAEAQGLPLMAREDLPKTGTFWLVTAGLGTGAAVPLPCPPTDASLPIFQMADGQFLVDGTKGQVVLNAKLPSVESALTAQADAVVSLITRVQETEMLSETAMLFGMELDSGGGPEMPLFAVTDPDGLWLEITNLANGFVHANLHNATNQVYAIWGTTDLLEPWQVEKIIWPADTNCEPFTLATQGRQMLFLRAEDWTGKDSNEDGVPDWWVWRYFGDVSQALTNLDYSGSGLTFAEDYSNSITPTVFSFASIQTANNYVSSSQPTVQLAVEGSPYYVAVLVDSDNFSNAVWNTYSGSSVSVNLGSAEGWHEVWIGLRGHADDPESAVWQRKRLKFDSTPPALFITSPTNATVDIPMIQLQGFSPEALSSISYDLTNAAGLLTGQQILVLNQHYDTNTWEFTTNTWQAFDVVLTNGLNTFTLHATDLAGNTATASYSVTLDYSGKTNAPTVQITWPTNGTEISGSRFTLDGFVADPTASVSATITATNGSTSTARGAVERNGRFWVDNLPLNSGTNTVSLQITDAAGNSSTTNISVVQSTVTLTMNPVTPDSDLWKPKVNLTGTISAPAYAIWVNGVKGHNNGDGTWSASDVPTTAGGVASFTITAYTPDEQQPDGSHGN